MGHAQASQPLSVEKPREGDTAPLAPSKQSTGALVVELSELEYAVRAWPRRNAWGSAAQADVDFRSLMLRKHAVLRRLRGRGLNFAEGSFDQPLQPQADGGGDRAAAPPDPAVGSGADATAQIEHLERALATRTVIGQALGILMERHRITSDEAFVMLRGASSVTNRKLRDIAADLAESGALARRT